jgi:hypothetical protein
VNNIYYKFGQTWTTFNDTKLIIAFFPERREHCVCLLVTVTVGFKITTVDDAGLTTRDNTKKALNNSRNMMQFGHDGRGRLLGWLAQSGRHLQPGNHAGS